MSDQNNNSDNQNQVNQASAGATSTANMSGDTTDAAELTKGLGETNTVAPTEIPLNQAVSVPDPYDTVSPVSGDIGVPQSSNNSTVIVPGNGGGAPKWFYMLFVLTVLAFIIVTGLLVYSTMGKNKSGGKAVPTMAPPTVTAFPSLIPSPTRVASQSADFDFLPLTASDSIVDIDTDIKNTDLGEIDKGLVQMEKGYANKPTP